MAPDQELEMVASVVSGPLEEIVELHSLEVYQAFQEVLG